MADVEASKRQHLANIEQRSGKSLAQLHALLRKSGFAKHGELVAFLKSELGMGHGDANAVALSFKAAQTPAAASADPLDAIYAGSKAALRPLHEAVLKKIAALGEFEQAPKKAWVSLRRAKQFAMVGPGTKGRLDIGINLRGVKPTARLEAMPEGSMCQCKVRITDAKEIDKELLGWLRAAFDAAG